MVSSLRDLSGYFLDIDMTNYRMKAQPLVIRATKENDAAFWVYFRGLPFYKKVLYWLKLKH